MSRARTALLLSRALGVALEVGTLGDRTGLPIAVVLAGAIGYFSSGRGWMTPAVIGPAQFAAALYRGANMASAWLGPFVYFVALSVPMVLAAYVGRRMRLRRG
jgi:hypothetical protein